MIRIALKTSLIQAFVAFLSVMAGNSCQFLILPDASAFNSAKELKLPSETKAAGISNVFYSNIKIAPISFMFFTVTFSFYSSSLSFPQDPLILRKENRLFSGSRCFCKIGIANSRNLIKIQHSEPLVNNVRNAPSIFTTH